MGFVRAKREQKKLRLALCGPAGAGKTYSALLLARGVAGPTGRIAVLDTEHGSASLYSDLDEYDIQSIDAPYTCDKYEQAIREAEQAGYDVLIIDSLTHAWAGEGGLLDQQGKIADSSPSKNSYAAWRTITPKHNRLVERILGCGLHLICCARSKTEYVIEDNGSGKKSPVKKGMAPILRDGMDFEFDVVLDLEQGQHLANTSKTRIAFLDGMIEVPTVEMGTRIAAWLQDAPAAAKKEPPAPEEQTVQEMWKVAKQLEVSADKWRAFLAEIGISKEIDTHTAERKQRIREWLQSQATGQEGK